MLQMLLASQHADTDLDLWIFHDSLSPKKADALRRLVEQRQGRAIRFVSVDPRRHFSGRPPFGLMSYARLLIPTYIPSGRVVYLDTDVLVSDDIRHLMTYPMKTAVAAVADRTAGRSNCQRFLIGRGVESDTPYFNAGVLVIDCGKWNSLDVTGALLGLGAKERWRLPSGDQTLLNLYFRGAFDPLPNRYNVFAWAAAPIWTAGKDHAVMTHFLGRPKPWELGGRVNLRHVMYRQLLVRLDLQHAPWELTDVFHVASRVARYLPSYWKCLRNRVRRTSSAKLSPA